MLKERHEKIIKDENLKKLYKELESENKKILELQWEYSTMYFDAIGSPASYVENLENNIAIHIEIYNKILYEITNYVKIYKKRKLKRNN